jgi:hypothetical protein
MTALQVIHIVVQYDRSGTEDGFAQLQGTFIAGQRSSYFETSFSRLFLRTFD